jgi:hypothetical protein
MNLVAREYVKKLDRQVHRPTWDAILRIDSALLAGKPAMIGSVTWDTFEAWTTGSGWRSRTKQ